MWQIKTPFYIILLYCFLVHFLVLTFVSLGSGYIIQKCIHKSKFSIRIHTTIQSILSAASLDWSLVTVSVYQKSQDETCGM